MKTAREFKGIWIPKHIWLNKDLSISEMFILAEIESYDNDFGCVATNKTLCEDLRIQPSTASGLIKSLEDKGFIQVEYKNYNTFEGRKITVLSTPFGNPKGASEKSGGASEKSIPSNIFSNTLMLDTNVSTSNLTFDRFWKIYPVKKEKKKTQQKWNKISISDKQKIFSTIDSFLNDKPFATYNIPYPITYLNGERWNDDYKIQEEKSNEDSSVDIGDLYAQLRGE